METNFNFKSQVATSREQSERLLALGLKKETADMYHAYLNEWDGWCIRPVEMDERLIHTDIPAWSLHRLIEMYAERYISCSMNLKDLTYEWLINEIEIHIKEGDFNKEYLV